MYATGTIAIVDTKNLMLRLFDFGHGMCWLKRDNKIYSLYPKNPPSGIPFLGINPELLMTSQLYKIKKNDMLYSVSDGVIETKNSSRENFGTERMINLLKNHEYHEVNFGYSDLERGFRFGFFFLISVFLLGSYRSGRIIFLFLQLLGNDFLLLLFCNILVNNSQNAVFGNLNVFPI